MNNFEKRKFLDYLEKLLPYIDTNSYSFDNIFEFMLDEFKMDKSKYTLDEDEELVLDTRKKRDVFEKIFYKDIKYLKSKIKPQKTLLEKQFNILRDLYVLSNEEYEIMMYLSLEEINGIFKALNESLKNNSFATFTREYLGMRYSRKDRIMDSLYLKNIVESRRSESINEDFFKIFDNPKCNTSEKIVNTIIGKPEKSHLTLKDYDYLEKYQKK